MFSLFLAVAVGNLDIVPITGGIAYKRYEYIDFGPMMSALEMRIVSKFSRGVQGEDFMKGKFVPIIKIVDLTSAGSLSR